MLGLGIVLEFHDRASADIKRAGQSVKDLKGDVLDSALAIQKQAEMLERKLDQARRNVATGMKEMLAGGAMVTAPALFIRMGMEAEDQLSRIGITMLAQGKSIDFVSAKLSKYEDIVDNIANTKVAVADSELLKGFDLLLSRLGEDVAIGGIEQLGKFSEISKAMPEQAAQFTTAMLDLFGNTTKGSTTLEKMNSILDTSAAATGMYRMSIEDLNQSMALVRDEVGLFGLSFEEAMALMGPLLQSGKAPRMAASSLREILKSFIGFDDRIKAMKKAAKKDSLTIADLTGLNEAAIPADVIPFTKIRMTDAKGKLLPVLDILRNIKVVLDKMGGLNAGQKNWFMSNIGADVLSAVSVLDKIDSGLADLQKRTGELDKQFGFVAKKSSHEWTLVKNQIGDVAEQLGLDLLPAATEVFKSMRGVSRAVGDIVKNNPELIKWGFYLWTGAGALRAIGGTVFILRNMGSILTGTIAMRGMAGQLGALTTGGVVAGGVGTGAGATAAGAGAVGIMRYIPYIAAAAAASTAGYITYEKLIKPLMHGEKSIFELELVASAELKKMQQDGLIPEPLELGGKVGEAFNAKIKEALSSENAAAFGLKIGEALKIAADKNFDWEGFDPGGSAVMKEAKRVGLGKKLGTELEWYTPWYAGASNSNILGRGMPQNLRPAGRAFSTRSAVPMTASSPNAIDTGYSSVKPPSLLDNPMIHQTITGPFNFHISGYAKDPKEIADEVKRKFDDVSDRATEKRF